MVQISLYFISACLFFSAVNGYISRCLSHELNGVVNFRVPKPEATGWYTHKCKRRHSPIHRQKPYEYMLNTYTLHTQSYSHVQTIKCCWRCLSRWCSYRRVKVSWKSLVCVHDCRITCNVPYTFVRTHIFHRCRRLTHSLTCVLVYTWYMYERTYGRIVWTGGGGGSVVVTYRESHCRHTIRAQAHYSLWFWLVYVRLCTIEDVFSVRALLLSHFACRRRTK